MGPLVIVVPGEPRGKGRPRFVSTPRGGRTYTDAETVAFERMVAWCAKQAGAVPVGGPVNMTVRAYLQIPKSASKKRQAEMLAGIDRPTKKPDADNILKALADGLNGIAIHDDTQIVDLTISKFWSLEPRLEIEISPAMAITERRDGIERNKAA